jgi:uncharacterized protein (DUF488 family)
VRFDRIAGMTLQTAMSLVKSEPSVLVCMEAKPECCHRAVLAQHLTGMMELPIKHLG